MYKPLESFYTPKNIAASEFLDGPSLSKDGKQVLYRVSYYKEGEHERAALWIANTDEPDSARPLTSGLFNDNQGVFHPDSERVIFLSDRHKAGGKSQLYSISLKGGEAAPLTPTGSKKGISSFVESPDGKYIAFMSPDEPSEEDERKEKEKDDAKVFGDRKDFERLRIYTFSTGTVRTLDLNKDLHVAAITWSAHSTELLVRLHIGVTIEASESQALLERISIAPGSRSVRVGSYVRSPRGTTIWTPAGTIVDALTFEPVLISAATALFIHDSQEFTKTDRVYGEEEDVAGFVDLQFENLFAVEVATGVDSRIDILDGSRKLFTLFKTDREAISWDAKRLSDGTYVFAVISSSRIKNEPWNVRIGRSTGTKRVSLDLKLSSHYKWLSEAPPLLCHVIDWVAEDGTKLQGIVTRRQDSSKDPRPTILLVHGGPYYRDVPALNPATYSWHELLAEAGYLILSPNYRGGSGRGQKFARAAHAGMGQLDWSDCESMLDEAIKLGWADPKRLGIAGWSQGGFMTAWGVTKTKNKFKAGVMGAGVSDWGALAAESDSPGFEADLGGSAPWTPGTRVDQEGSPIRFVEGVETAVLIIHGEEDRRVPVSQAIAFMRGLKRQGKYPDRYQLVTYPREPHGFKERKHVEDVLTRVLEHFDTWLK